MDDWDKLDQNFSGKAPAKAAGDPWDELDASVAAKPAAAAPAPAKPAPLSQLPRKGAASKQTRMDRVLQGMRDPIDGGAQLLTHMLPDGLVKSVNSANNWLADKTGLVAKLPEGGIDQQLQEREAKYQQARRDAMPTTLSSQITGQKEDPGFDGYRMIGNVASPVNVVAAANLPKMASIGGRMAVGAGFGAGTGALAPVTQGDFGSEKLTQIGIGTAFGGALPAITGGIGRIVSPKASTNASLQLLKREGVRPTVGQALGGMANTIEQKLTSVPLMGDMIARARGKAMESFNTAAINRATGPVGQKADDIGHAGVANAGDKVAAAYDDALSSLGVVRFDNQFAQQASQLQTMAQNLVPQMRDKFTQTYKDLVVARMSPNGSMLSDTFKKVDSELGAVAARYNKSALASEQDVGDAIKELRTILQQQAARNDPGVAAKLKQADAGYANLVRVEGAAKAAMNNEGVFTPAQLNTAIRAADQSVRKRAVGRGKALMQDLGNAGQKVLGNKVPDSGTAARAMWGGGALATGVLNPWIPASLLAGAGAYTGPVQRLLVGAASSRPQSAKAIAEALKKSSPYAVPLSSQIYPGLLD